MCPQCPHHGPSSYGLFFQAIGTCRHSRTRVTRVTRVTAHAVTLVHGFSSLRPQSMHFCWLQGSRPTVWFRAHRVLTGGIDEGIESLWPPRTCARRLPAECAPPSPRPLRHLTYRVRGMPPLGAPHPPCILLSLFKVSPCPPAPRLHPWFLTRHCNSVHPWFLTRHCNCPPTSRLYPWFWTRHCNSLLLLACAALTFL